MVRIAGVPTRDAGPLGRLAYRIARYRYGAVPEPATVLLHHRPAFWAYALWELGNEKAMRRLSASLRELVVYRVATQVGCSWCVDFGTMLQRHHGLDLERLRELDNYQTSPAFTPTERRALAYADAMTALPTTVTDEMVAALDAELGHDGLVELTYAIAVENHRALQPCPGHHRPGVHLRAGMPCAASFVNARATSAPKSTPMVAHITS